MIYPPIALRGLEAWATSGDQRDTGSHVNLARTVTVGLRSPEGQAGRNARALQGEEHGRRAVGARGVPGDLRNVSVSTSHKHYYYVN